MTDVTQHETAATPRGRGLLEGGNKLKLGLFGTNVSYGLSMTHSETTYRPTWEHSLAIAQRADEMGFELLIPVARWRGFGGTTDMNGENFETFTWAAATAAHTKNITVVATSHLPMVHPVVAAKQSVTIDHVSEGRFGLNMVMGWFTPEMEMFGDVQREHDDRYRFGAEWLDVCKRLWAEEEPFDFEGEDFQLTAARSYPQPLQKPHPLLINAGNSPAAMEFSARHVDVNFLTIGSMEAAAQYVQDIKAKAASYGRDISVMTYVFIICRDTEEEAQAVRQDMLEKGDRVAARNVMDVLGVQSESFTEHMRQGVEDAFIVGWGAHNIVGTPEQVARQLGELSDMGIDGVIAGFLDYHEELASFDEQVMPLLVESGLRRR
jgi:alkanesulfonate monooxygenase SsuD/methylene tetrahydromethanopterin reductase-like flavin-dependent oxidoreductase (luciferase family)